MATPIRMPQPGQMTEACTVLRWHKAEGDRVTRGDALFEIETDKSNMEVEAFTDGTLLRIVVGEGVTAPVDSVVAWIGAPGEALPETAEMSAAEPQAPATEQAPATAPSPHPVRPTADIAAAQAAAAARRPAVSPRAGRLAAELGVDLGSVSGSGPGGRIVERDVRAAAETWSGPRPAVADRASPPTADGVGEPLGRLRRVIARRLAESAATIPHFSVTVAVDMTGLVSLRAELRAVGSPISLTDFVHAATVAALVEHPLLNAATDGRVVWHRDRVHLGIAVAVPGGLLVPVVRDAQALGLPELGARSAALVEAARAGRLGPDELSGSTFTVSNMGMLGVERFTAIINPGESGILAVGSARPEAVVLEGGLAVREVMRVTLSADHRLIDGELGARFLATLRRRLEDAASYRASLATATEALRPPGA